MRPKTFVAATAAAALFLTTCAVAPAHSAQPTQIAPERANNRASYSALFIAQWVYNCTTQIAPRFGANGLPQQLAIQYAAQECSCVVDQFMNDFTQTEILNMTLEDRSAFGDTYASHCLANSL